MDKENGVTGDDRRKHERLKGTSDISVKIQSSPDGVDMEGANLNIDISDISYSGVRLQTHVDIPETSMLEMIITISGISERFHHTGLVIWSREITGGPTDETRYQVGVAFMISDNPQYDSWTDAIAQYKERQ